jgi:hypothetical protein
VQGNVRTLSLTENRFDIFDNETARYAVNYWAPEEPVVSSNAVRAELEVEDGRFAYRGDALEIKDATFTENEDFDLKARARWSKTYHAYHENGRAVLRDIQVSNRSYESHGYVDEEVKAYFAASPATGTDPVELENWENFEVLTDAELNIHKEALRVEWLQNGYFDGQGNARRVTRTVAEVMEPQTLFEDDERTIRVMRDDYGEITQDQSGGALLFRYGTDTAYEHFNHRGKARDQKDTNYRYRYDEQDRMVLEADGSAARIWVDQGVVERTFKTDASQVDSETEPW